MFIVEWCCVVLSAYMLSGHLCFPTQAVVTLALGCHHLQTDNTVCYDTTAYVYTPGVR